MSNTNTVTAVKDRSRSFKITITALFAALTCISTMVIQIPSPTNGYIHPGDCFVLLSGWLLGPLYGFVAAGTGGMLADLLSGYVIYAPATLIIKGVMSLTAYLLLRVFSGRKPLTMRLGTYISYIVSEMIMIAGYFIFSSICLGTGLAAVSGIPANAVQGLFAVIASPVMFSLIRKMHINQSYEN